MRYLSVLLLFVLLGCDPPANDPGGATGNPQQPQQPAPNDRDRWQKPEVIIGLMGSISGTTVADLFADDGYFTFKFIDAGANVIAVVNETAKAEHLEAEKKRRGLPDERLRIRMAAMGDPGIAGEEADFGFIAHRFLTIKDKPAYMARMRAGLRPPRYLVMLDWQYRETTMGPPMGERMPTDRIMDLVGEVSGYTDVGAHSDKVPDQVVFLINDYVDAGYDTGDPSMIVE